MTNTSTSTRRIEGQTIPHVTLRTRTQTDWKDIQTADYFANKTVVLFSLPGAFTPTCSSSHVPRYNQLAGAFAAHGVDEIICMSVNDAFVMNEWQEQQKAWNLRFLPDGNGEFTEQMGLLVDKEDLGFGRRSWRYSMLVKNGVIEKLFVEPSEPGDPYGVSDADTMFRFIAPDAATPLDATVFSRKGCPFCVQAKDALQDAGIAFEELVLNSDFTDRTLRAVSGRSTFPQVFVGGEHIGGAEELSLWLEAQKAA